MKVSCSRQAFGKQSIQIIIHDGSPGSKMKIGDLSLRSRTIDIHQVKGWVNMEQHPLTDEQIEGWWDIARVGKWNGSQGGRPVEIEINRADIKDIAETYSPQVQEAPVTV